MKAKKPLLLTVLVLVLLVVALIAPAAASGSNSNPPVNWVSFGANTNNSVVDEATGELIWQGQMSVLVQELANGDIVGHVQHQTIKSSIPDVFRSLARGDDFEYATFTDHHDGTKEVEFVVWTPSRVWYEKGAPQHVDAMRYKFWFFDGGKVAPNLTGMWIDLSPSNGAWLSVYGEYEVVPAGPGLKIHMK